MWSSAVITLQPRRQSWSCMQQDRPLIPGDHAGGEDDRVPLPQRDAGMGVGGDLGQRRTWLALAAGADQQEVVVRDEAGLLLRHVGRDVASGSRIPAPPPRRCAATGRTARPAARRPGAPRGMLSTRATLVAKQLTATRPFRPRMMAARLRRTSASDARMALDQRIGEVADHRQHAFLAQPGEGGLIGRLADQRSGSSFQSPVWTTMPCRVRMATAWASGTECATRRNSRSKCRQLQRPPSGMVMIFASPSSPASPSFRRSTAADEGAGIDRAAQHGPEMRDGTDMVLMRVGDHQPDQPVPPLGEPDRVGDHHLDLRDSPARRSRCRNRWRAACHRSDRR